MPLIVNGGRTIIDMATDFAADLARWGPHRSYDPVPLADARAYCRQLALTHYENFSVASLFVPRRLLRHFHHVYAYCRWADDLADETPGGPDALRLLDWWQSELLACYDGTPRHPVLVALQETVRQFDIPPAPFLDLLQAFQQDQIKKRYDTMVELLDYCRCSANPVGRIILYLGACHDAQRGTLSDHICTALQLTNFWQDVARDAALGRIYVPKELMQRFGVDDTSILARRDTPETQALIQHLVHETRDRFHQGLPLIRLMPRDLKMQVELFARGGLAILRKIEQHNYNVLARRLTLSKVDKAVLMAKVLGRRWRVGATA
jgi:squalene synthase HpnC